MEMPEQDCSSMNTVSLGAILEETIRLLLANDAARLSGLLVRLEQGQLPEAAARGERTVPRMLMLASLLARTRRNLRLLGRDVGCAAGGYGRPMSSTQIHS